MRKEDKVQLPPKIRLNLPPGYYVQRLPDEYLLFQAQQMVTGPRTGILHQLVGSFAPDAEPAEIETAAWNRAKPFV